MTSTSSQIRNDLNIPLAVVMNEFQAGKVGDLLEAKVDAILIETMGFSSQPIHFYADWARELNIPVLMMSPGKNESQAVVQLPVVSENYWGVMRGLQRIVDLAHQETDDPRIRYGLITEGARHVFARKNFYEKKPFLELMINPDIKAWADALEKTDKMIIVDCGHIDGERGKMSEDADELSLEEGAVAVQYLRQRGFDARLSVLFNDMRLFQERDKTSARRRSQQLYHQAKQEGTHDNALMQYEYLLRGYGFSPEVRKELMLSAFEGKLALQCRQDVAAYASGQDNPFVLKVQQQGKAFSYIVSGEKKKITTESGAPNCALLSAKLNQHYERLGADRILYLRDELQWGCAIRGGAATARELYGVTIPIDFIGYMESGNRVATLPVQNVGDKPDISCSA